MPLSSFFAVLPSGTRTTRLRPCAVRASGFAAVLLAGLAVLPGCAVPRADTAAPAAASRPITTELALATFDSAWSRINNTYYDPNFRGMDWQAVRSELRPRVEAARTEAEVRAVIREMLAGIGESHFGLIPREAADALHPDSVRAGTTAIPADVGVELRWVEDALVVTRVIPFGAAAAAGVQPGWVVEAIGEREVSSWREAIARMETETLRTAGRLEVVNRAADLLRGVEGSSARVRLRDGTGQQVERTLVRQPMQGEPVRLGNLPTLFAWLEHDRLPVGGGCIGVIRFNVWMATLAQPFGRAMDELAGCQGIVLDLRGNIGGLAGMAMGTAGAFLDHNASLGTMRTRQGELRFVAIPRRVTADGRPTAPYAGPLAILVDELSLSTSEIFAAGMQAVGRARIFGTASPGMALPAGMIRLPNQDVLYHAFADFTDPHGARIEGRGAIPDQSVPLTRSDLLAGRDGPLEAALEWIRSQPRSAAVPGR
jgi:carboxyl-terminal processing protease